MKERTVEDLSLEELRALVHDIQEGAIAGNSQDSYSDIGGFVVEALTNVGLRVEETDEERAAREAEWDDDTATS